ncbi:MAG: DNA repair protein RecO [Pedobacter sp.]|nr:MAG: DNA repair protein RecO [Pedobacter sp.]
MLHKTRGIALKTTDYSETSVIAQVFTEKFGLQSYLIQGAKKPKARIKLNLLQPLHLLDMVVYHKPGSIMQRVSELRHQPIFQSIPYDIAKSSIAIFLNEMLYKSIRQSGADEALFDFLFYAIEVLDQQEGGMANFHLCFLLRLTRFLGFYPDTTRAQSADYFDLKNGCYTLDLPPHTWVLQQPYTSFWISLLECHFNDLEKIVIPVVDRSVLLDKLIAYYQLHLEGFGQIKSYAVLKELFR